MDLRDDFIPCEACGEAPVYEAGAMCAACGRTVLEERDQAEAELTAFIERVAGELAHLNAHGEECSSRKAARDGCDVCDSTDEADDHCDCWLALRRDLLAALPKQGTTT